MVQTTISLRRAAEHSNSLTIVRTPCSPGNGNNVVIPALQDDWPCQANHDVRAESGEGSGPKMHNEQAGDLATLHWDPIPLAEIAAA